jgi:hypothetical protein
MGGWDLSWPSFGLSGTLSLTLTLTLAGPGPGNLRIPVLPARGAYSGLAGPWPDLAC